MKTMRWSLLLATLCIAPQALADEEDGEKREDPWEYDKDREAKKEESERADKASERSFGNSGDVAISAERVLGLASTSTKIKLPGPDDKNSVMRLNLLTNANQAKYGFSAPRIGFDYFVSDGISIGIALGYSSTSDDDDEKNGYFIASPRVGYAFMFSEMFGVWPRVGATYLDGKIGGDKLGVVAVSGELALVIVPWDHVSFTLGPTYDGAVFGKINPAGAQGKTDFAIDEFGAQAGLTAFF